MDLEPKQVDSMTGQLIAALVAATLVYYVTKLTQSCIGSGEDPSVVGTQWSDQDAATQHTGEVLWLSSCIW